MKSKQLSWALDWANVLQLWWSFEYSELEQNPYLWQGGCQKGTRASAPHIDWTSWRCWGRSWPSPTRKDPVQGKPTNEVLWASTRHPRKSENLSRTTRDPTTLTTSLVLALHTGRPRCKRFGFARAEETIDKVIQRLAADTVQYVKELMPASKGYWDSCYFYVHFFFLLKNLVQNLNGDGQTST